MGWHQGELALQQAFNFQHGDRMRGMVKTELPAIANQFLRTPKLIAMTVIDKLGQPVTAIFESRGDTIDAEPNHLVIRRSHFHDPAFDQAAQHSQFIGFIAVNFHERQRMRINGRLTHTGSHYRIDFDEVYSNCPKYIQTYTKAENLDQKQQWTALSEFQSEMNQSIWVPMIEKAQTAFLGTCHPAVGCDASHRGGAPGFLKFEAGQIVMPDYRGNFMYQSLGNIYIDPRLSLFVIDADSNSGLRISAKTTIQTELSQADKDKYIGAQA